LGINISKQMSEYEYKIKNFIEDQIKNIKNPSIIEFGVKEGRSTKMFLDLCEKNNGELFSIDITDYSNLFNDKNWNFILSRDDNFEYLESKLPKKIDIIYLDSLHEADHVENIFYYYFKKLKINGLFYIDDISWLPYLKNSERNNFYCEINNRETFERLLSIYASNNENFDIEFSFQSSGICKIIKKRDELRQRKKIVSRQISIKNILKKIYNKFK
tara:strand:- start:1889 stop:2536 length:648 start_codon:yes stop_codon:yes gene_type:complete